MFYKISKCNIMNKKCDFFPLIRSVLAALRYPIGYRISLCTLSHAFKTSSLSVRFIAASDASSCSVVVAPMIVEATKLNCFDHAVAKVTGCIPASCAIFIYFWVDASVLSFKNLVAIALCLILGEFTYSLKRPCAFLSRLYLPLSTPPARGEYGNSDTCSFSAIAASSSRKRRLSNEKLFCIDSNLA